MDYNQPASTKKTTTMAATKSQFTLYTSPASQWAMVPHLGLIEKAYLPHEYSLEEVDLMGAGNFHIDYLKANNAGTIPALTASDLKEPLMESTDILEYIDRAHNNSGPTLAAKNAETKAVMTKLINLVHSPDLNTNLILLQARDAQELDLVKGNFGTFIATRQRVLEKNHADYPDHPFYGPKSTENGGLHKLYITPIGAEHESFFEQTHEAYKKFAKAFDELEDAVVLPYAVGEDVTYADLNMVPWLAHALTWAGAKGFDDWGSLEDKIGKSVAGWKVGEKMRAWWKNVQGRKSFKEVFPQLH